MDAAAAVPSAYGSLRMDRRDYTQQNVVLPLVLGVLGNFLALLGVFVISTAVSVAWWMLVSGAVVLAALATLGLRRPIRRRYVTLKVLEEVSAARCGDYFVRLAELCFRELRRPDRAHGRLREVANIRRYPNSRFLEDLTVLITQAPDASAKRAAERYLRTVPNVRRLTRAEVLEKLSQFVRGLPDETQIVLYGYSSTVCEGLARCAAWLSLPVFLVEDLQYGLEGSLGEHQHAQRHLEAAEIKPILLPFDQIAPLTSLSADFVRDAAGRSVPLSGARRPIALLGCEAVDVQGEILIPSRARGIPSETAKFIEVFHQSSQWDNGPTDVVVVSETYKVFEDLAGDRAVSHAPLKTSFARRALYLSGLTALPQAHEVELVRLQFATVHAIIDDAGVHIAADEPDLRASYQLWRDRTIGRLEEPPAPARLGELLDRAQVAIFDLNGVLMDDEAAHFAAFGDTLRAFKASLSYEEYLRYCSGRTDREGVENLSAVKSLPADRDELLEMKRNCYAQHRGDYPLLTFPGAVELAGFLQGRGVQCFLVTSSDQGSAHGFIRECDLLGVFPAERCSFEVESAQRGRVFERIARGAGADVARCLVFDDSPANLEVAQRLGMATIGVATTHPASRLVADVVVDGPLSGPEKLVTRE